VETLRLVRLAGTGTTAGATCFRPQWRRGRRRAWASRWTARTPAYVQ